MATKWSFIIQDQNDLVVSRWSLAIQLETTWWPLGLQEKKKKYRPCGHHVVLGSLMLKQFNGR
jgi:hypothetical protein